MPITLRPEHLTSEAFESFGDVIELPSGKNFPITKGFTIRHHDLAQVDVSDQDGTALISIFRFQPRP